MTATGMGHTSLAAQTQGRVLVVAAADRSPALVEALEAGGHVVQAVAAATEPLLVAGEPADLIVATSDSGIGLLHDVPAPVLLLAPEGSETAVPDWAFAVLPWSTPPATLRAMAALAAWLRDVRVRCAELEQLVAGLRDGSALVGRSPVMRRLADALRRAADNDATLLIEGQPGTGKSLAARVVHCKSRRCGLPLMTVECASVDADALARLLEESSNTTLILENIDRLPAAAQAVLVRHLKERPRAGTGSARPRVIATTANHLPELVARGAFREDLYYRLNVFPLRMPAVRERTEDVGLLAQTFLQASVASGASPRAGFTASALILLESMSWPGNVAQLESTIRRATVQAGGGPIDRTHLLGPTTGVTAPLEAKAEATSTQEDDVTEEMIRPFEEEEQLLLARALRATGGNVRRAAQLLGIGRATLYRKIQQYRLRLH